MKPKIAFDARMAFSSGIGTYSRSLLKELLKTDEFRWILLGDPDQLPVFFPGADIREFSAPVYTIQEQAGLTWKSSGFDLFHAPHYNAPLFTSSPLVVTVHDLIHFRFPHYFGSKVKLRAARFILERALAQARKVIAVSSATRADILERFRVSPEKICVIHEAASDLLAMGESPTEKDSLVSKFRLPSDFLLYVGNLKRHKNIPLLIRAVQALRKEGLKVELVVVGGMDQRSSEKAELEGLLKTEGVRWLGPLSRPDLASVYSLARGVVLPSLWEGFGLPVLEAFRAGVPVITSRVPALEEVVGPRGIFFDPLSMDEMKGAVRTLMSDAEARKDLVQNGAARLQLFSWKKCADETLQVYREVIDR